MNVVLGSILVTSAVAGLFVSLIVRNKSDQENLVGRVYVPAVIALFSVASLLNGMLYFFWLGVWSRTNT